MECKCDRDTYCQYPCSNYGKFKNTENSNPCKSMVSEDANAVKSGNLLDTSCNGDCLEGYLQYTVEEPEFLDVINGNMDIMNMIDMSALLSYMSKINEIYCESHNLCEKCHSELIEVDDPRGECHGRPCTEKIVVCPKCG